MTVICVSRQLRRVVGVNSHLAVFHSNGCVSAMGIGSVAVSRVMTVVINHRVASCCPGISMGPNRGLLRIASVERNSALGNVSFCTHTNRVANFCKLVNTNHARLVHTVFNTSPFADNRVGMGNRSITVGSYRRTGGLNLTLLARSHGDRNLVLRFSLGRGVSLTGVGATVASFNFGGTGRATRGRGLTSSVHIGAPSLRRGTGGLSNNGRRGIIVYG